MIVEFLETIPQPGTSLVIDSYPIEIVEADDNRIRSVRIGERNPFAEDTTPASESAGT